MYDRDFKKNVCQMAIRTSCKTAAQEFGVCSASVSNWMKKYAAPTETVAPAAKELNLVDIERKLLAIKKLVDDAMQKRNIITEAEDIIGKAKEEYKKDLAELISLLA